MHPASDARKSHAAEGRADFVKKNERRQDRLATWRERLLSPCARVIALSTPPGIAGSTHENIEKSGDFSPVHL
jgi:hypothetical protein